MLFCFPRSILLTLFHTATLHSITSSPFFLATGVLSPEQHNAAKEALETIVRDDLAGQALHVVDAWALPGQVLRETPAASVGNNKGWDQFNAGDNRGEVFGGNGIVEWPGKAKL